MAGKRLLDTNVVIAILAHEDESIRRVSEAQEVYLSATVLGELEFGARNSGRVEENLGRIREFAGTVTVLQVDETTAEMYGAIRHVLRRAGQPIPDNDAWIAATAMQHDLTLVTRDAHFHAVEHVRIEHW
jgi:tRNA(fMet)-specific endonuclease VapC